MPAELIKIKSGKHLYISFLAKCNNNTSSTKVWEIFNFKLKFWFQRLVKERVFQLYNKSWGQSFSGTLWSPIQLLSFSFFRKCQRRSRWAKSHVETKVKQPNLISWVLLISIFYCDCWTYDDNISLKLKKPSFVIWGA